MTKDRSLIKDISLNSFGEIGSRFPLMLIEIIIAKYLGPITYGIWSTIQLVVNYNNFIHFGFLSALAREEPILIGKKKDDQANHIRNIVFTAVLFITITLGLIAIAIFYLVDQSQQNWLKYRDYILLIYALFICQQIFIFWQTTLQNRFQFLLLSMGKIIYSGAFLALVLMSISAWNITGVIASWGISYFITIVFFVCKAPHLLPRFSVDFAKLRTLFLVGFPIFCFGIAKLLLTTIDKLSIIAFLNVEQLGYYNITATFLAITALIGGLFSRVLSPHLLSQVGEGDSKIELYQFFMTNTLKATIYLALASGLLAIFIQPFLWYVLPEYISGRYVGFLLIFIGALSGITQFFSVYLVALHKQKIIFVLTLISLAVTIAFIYITKTFFNIMEYYAVASLFGWITFVFLLIREFLFATFGNRKKFFEVTFQIFRPIILMAFIAFITFYIQDNLPLGNALKLVLGYLAFMILLIPVLSVLKLKDDLLYLKNIVRRQK